MPSFDEISVFKEKNHHDSIVVVLLGPLKELSNDQADKWKTNLINLGPQSYGPAHITKRMFC